MQERIVLGVGCITMTEQRPAALRTRTKRALLRTRLRAIAVMAVVSSAAAPASAESSTAPASARPSSYTVARRSTMDHNLTSADQANIRELGIGQPHAGAVVIRKISKNEGRQMERLQELATGLDGFLPAGLCDRIVAQGAGRALCMATTEGPLGSLPARLPMEARFERREGGATRLVLRNARSLEVKFLFSWMEIVKPNNIQVAFDLLPQPDGYLLYTRVGVILSKREDTAEKLCTLLLKLDTWLAKDLAQS